MDYNTQAIVLNRYPYKEHDLKVLVYTKEKGRLELLARGARKKASKLVGHIEPFTLIDLLVISGKSMDYATSATNIKAYTEIKNNLEKLQATGKAIAFIIKAVKFEEKDEQLFYLIKSFLEFVNNNDNSGFVANVFIFKALEILGYHPQLTGEGAHFSFRRGELTDEGTKISLGLIEFLKQLYHYDFTNQLILDSAIQKEFNDFIERSVNYRVE